MTAVEFLAKSRPYSRQVCAGSLTSEPLSGKNTSAGLRATCTIQFTAAQTVTTRTVPRTIRMANGATRNARSARLAARPAVAERRARRLWVHVLGSALREIVACDRMRITPVCRAACSRPLQRTREVTTGSPQNTKELVVSMTFGPNSGLEPMSAVSYLAALISETMAGWSGGSHFGVTGERRPDAS